MRWFSRRPGWAAGISTSQNSDEKIGLGTEEVRSGTSRARCYLFFVLPETDGFIAAQV
jgi:hypothetical protein